MEQVESSFDDFGTEESYVDIQTEKFWIFFYACGAVILFFTLFSIVWGIVESSRQKTRALNAKGGAGEGNEDKIT